MLAEHFSYLLVELCGLTPRNGGLPLCNNSLPSTFDLNQKSGDTKRGGSRRISPSCRSWKGVNAFAKTLRIERSVDDTDKHGLRIKGPKTERGKRTITIDDDLIALLVAERERYLRMVAGVPDGVSVDLALVKLPAGALIFPSPGDDLTKPRHPRGVTKEFKRRAKALGFRKLRFHDLRGTHETLLLDAGVPVHVVATRCGHDPAVMLRCYAKRTRKADVSAAAVIGAIAKGTLRI